MCHGTGQFDMTHPLSTNLSQGHLNAALFTDNAAVLEPLVLAAQALVIFYRAENLGAKKTISLWFESTIIDGLWLFDLAKGP